MKKSEARRQAMLDAAAEVFAESGYDRTSMSDICTRVGYSKATLYGYFASKEALFLELVEGATRTGLDALHAALSAPAPGLAAALERYARQFLAHGFSPRVTMLRRLLAAHAGRPGFEARRYDLGTARGAALLAGLLRSAMDAGDLREADHGRAALHLKALLEAEWNERYLFETPPALTPEQVERTATIGVATFMAAYGPARPPGAAIPERA